MSVSLTIFSVFNTGWFYFQTDAGTRCSLGAWGCTTRVGFHRNLFNVLFVISQCHSGEKQNEEGSRLVEKPRFGSRKVGALKKGIRISIISSGRVDVWVSVWTQSERCIISHILRAITAQSESSSRSKVSLEMRGVFGQFICVKASWRSFTTRVT